MKRRDLVKRIEGLGAAFVREGGQHTVYRTRSGRTVTVPRHNEVNDITARSILKDAEESAP